VFETFKKVATSGQGVDFEQWYQGEGMRHWFRFIVVKQEQLLVVITEDITARKQAEQALIEANKNLTQSNTTLARTNVDLDNFVYTASHDLKAPISNIEGLIKLLEGKLQKQGYWDEHILRLVAMVHASISRFKETVADLTKVANVQKQVDSPTEVVDMKEMIEGILLDLHEDIRASAANIELQMDEGVKIVFTKKNFKSIFYNLISNALKYRHAERNPHITLTCQLQGAYQVVSVEDNGLGLNTKDENKIFGMFKRQHNHVEGSGIGLYLVKRMIENAGGKITVESKLGIGSTFRIYFPHQVEISHDIK
jgi:light-regulated signal transduction histidine kinase (bacteriophytochrome)